MLVALSALGTLACGGGAGSDDDDDAPAADAVAPGGVIDAAAPTGFIDAALPGAIDAGTPGTTIDAGTQPGGPPYLLLTCQRDVAQPDAGVGDATGTSCCDPDGTCPTGYGCVHDAARNVTECRPACGAQGECGGDTVCAPFASSPTCVVGGAEGAPCAPEFCSAPTVCVGPSAAEASCHRRCTTNADCEAPQQCYTLTGSTARACI